MTSVGDCIELFLNLILIVMFNLFIKFVTHLKLSHVFRCSQVQEFKTSQRQCKSQT